MKINSLYKYLPKDGIINWKIIEEGILKPFVKELKETMQETKWHAEKDVYTHTKMVCQELIKLEEYKLLDDKMKLVLFLSALFHDIGKPSCTKIINGEIRSFHHPTKGALITREYFWKELEISGSNEYQEFREGIALLVRYHSEPTYFNYEKDKNKAVIKLSLNSKHTKYFNNKLLSLLALADIRGRICDDSKEKEQFVLEFIDYAKMLNCYEVAFEFKNEYTKIKYLNSNNIWYNQELYDPTWGEVVIVCGLPGTGKDTFIKKHFSHLKMISLDDIRKELKIKPTDNQSAVINLAKERAKNYLRDKTPFVWNATNITNLTRDSQIKLFHDYNVKVRVIFLETAWQENIKRNQNRIDSVNIAIIEKMLGKLTIVEDTEAEYIEWICI